MKLSYVASDNGMLHFRAKVMKKRQLCQAKAKKLSSFDCQQSSFC